MLNPRKLLTRKGEFKAIDAADIPVDDEALGPRLVEWAQSHKLTHALGHADDGVIWGWFDTTWHWSGDAFSEVSPQLKLATLQQIRLFGADAEVFLWRVGRRLHGRLAKDVAYTKELCFEEPQTLWGTANDGQSDDFVLMREGAQGLRYAMPGTLASADGHRPQLRVRSYIDYDKDGCVRVVGSRLVTPEEGL